jgi:hypothetical protein
MNSRAVRVELGELGDIGAADKGALARAGDDDEAQRRVGFERLHCIDDLDHQRAVQ